jgi:hypothetical protein
MTLFLINTLEWLILDINRYICPIIFIFGILGNILNLIIFTRQTFLKQSCSLYFLCISLNNLAMYLIGLTTRIIDDGFNLNLVYNNSTIYCKLRNYLVYTLFANSSWLLVFASLDRYFAINQSTLQRQFYCSYRMAFKLITLTIIICLLAHIHMLIFYDYYLTLDSYGRLTLTCTTNSLTYDLFYAFFILIFYSLLPPLLMSIISLLTIKKFRQSRRQINPVMIFTLSRIMKTRRDTNQLIKVLSLQIFLLILFTIPHSIYWLYIAFTSVENSNKSNLQKEYEKLALNIVRILLYINYGSSFYIRMIISKTFRQEFIKFLRNYRRRN